ncbi:MAG: RICIN domain-containing protein [Lysobacterales bacterium]
MDAVLRTAETSAQSVQRAWMWWLCLLLLSATCLAAEPLRIVSRWKPDEALHTERGPITAGAIRPGWHSAQWYVEPVQGERYVRLRNRHTGLYLHAEHQRLEVGEILPGWWSAMWTLEAERGTDFVRLRNRWLESYVHIEHGRAELGEIQPGWWSAQWLLQPVVESRDPPRKRSAERAPAPSFSGESLADGQLRQDIFFQVAVSFESTYRCPIELVRKAVDRVERNSGGDLLEVEETWTAHGCGQRERYRVLISPGLRGGTDISVMVRE